MWRVLKTNAWAHIVIYIHLYILYDSFLCTCLYCETLKSIYLRKNCFLCFGYLLSCNTFIVSKSQFLFLSFRFRKYIIVCENPYLVHSSSHHHHGHNKIGISRISERKCDAMVDGEGNIKGILLCGGWFSLCGQRWLLAPL